MENNTAEKIRNLEGMVSSLTELLGVQEKVVAEQSERIRESEARFRALFNTSNDAIMLLTEDGFFDCNPSTLKFFGIASKDELMKVHPAELSPPVQPDGRPSPEAEVDHIQTAFRTGTDRFEWLHRRSDGTDFPAEVVLSAFDWRGKRVLQATVRDISERKQAEKAIRESEDRYRTLAEASPDQIFIIGRDDTMQYANTMALKRFRLPASEVIGKARKDLFPPDIVSAQEPGIRQVFDTGEPVRREEMIRFGTREFWIDTSLVPLKDEAGTVRRILGIARDITERRQAEKALKESNEQFITFIKEAAMRLKNPLEVVEGNLASVVNEIEQGEPDCADTALHLRLQMKNLEQIRKNIIELNKAIVARTGELSEASKRFLTE